jgi:arabinofuranosyltransferase
MQTKVFLILDITLALAALIFSLFAAIRPSKSKLLALALPIALVLIWFLLQSGYFFSVTVDDSYISLKYASNLYSGNGLTFNIDTDHPIEGYSNFLWILLLTPLFSLGGDILLWVKCLSLLLSVINLFLTYLLARKYCHGTIAILAPLFLVSFPQFAWWTVGGLETPLYICLLLAGSLLLSGIVSKKSRQNSPPSNIRQSGSYPEGIPRILFLALIFWALSLCRFEGIALFPTAIGLLLYNYVSEKSHNTRRLFSILLFSVAVAMLYLAYYFWRAEYYQSLLPNVFYAKVHFEPSSLVRRVLDKLELLYLVAPLVILSLLKREQKSIKPVYIMATFTIVLFFLSFLAYREWMVGFRYALPALPFLIILAVGGYSALITKNNSGSLPRAFVIALLLITVPQTSLLGLVQAKKDYIQSEQTHQDIAVWLNKNASPEETLALWDMGLIPYCTNLKHYYDIHREGLLESHSNQFGYSAEYFLEQRPDYILLVSKDRSPNRDSLGVNDVGRLFSQQEKFWSNYSPVYSLEYAEDRFFVLFKLTPEDLQ